MGATSPKEIDVNVHLNIIQNGEKKIIRTSIDKNNPSAVINISTLNSETTDTETSQISQTKQNGRISQVSQTNPNVKDSHNFEYNVDPAPPMSMASSQQSSINTSTNEQFNINHGGDNRNQNEKKIKNDTTPNKGNIDINVGGNRRVDENGTPNETTKGNIDINVGGNRRVYENENPNETTKGNIDINVGGNGRVDENGTPKETTKGNIDINVGGNGRIDGNETPYSKPKNTVDIGYLDDNDSDDLSFSRKFYLGNISDINSMKELINKRVEEGYFPLFFQLDKEKPLFLFIKNYETMQNVLEEYKNLNGINDGNKEYTLYNKETKEEIPQNKPIKDLGLKGFIFISNNK